MGCKKRTDKHKLLRFTIDSRGQFRVDVQKQAQGRGVYVCPQFECIQIAVQKGGFSKGLKQRLGPLNPHKIVAKTIEDIVIVKKKVVDGWLKDGRMAHLKKGQGRGEQRAYRFINWGECKLQITDKHCHELVSVWADQLNQLQRKDSSQSKKAEDRV